MKVPEDLGQPLVPQPGLPPAELAAQQGQQQQAVAAAPAGGSSGEGGGDLLGAAVEGLGEVAGEAVSSLFEGAGSLAEGCSCLVAFLLLLLGAGSALAVALTRLP